MAGDKEKNNQGNPMETTKIEVDVTIKNPHGLHARPAAQFVRVAGQFEDCHIVVNRDGMEVNGKSIMGMMMLQAGEGTMIKIIAEGEGAGEACDELQKLVDSGFGE